VTSLTSLVERPICDSTVSGNSRDWLVYFFKEASYYGSEPASYFVLWEMHPRLMTARECSVYSLASLFVHPPRMPAIRVQDRLEAG